MVSLRSARSLVVAEGRGRNRLEDVQVVGQQVHVRRIGVVVEGVLDTFVLRGALAAVLRVRLDDEALVVVPRDKLVWAIRDGVLAEAFWVVEPGLGKREVGVVPQASREVGLRLGQFDGEGAERR